MIRTIILGLYVISFVFKHIYCYMYMHSFWPEERLLGLIAGASGLIAVSLAVLCFTHSVVTIPPHGMHLLIVLAL